MTLLVVHLWAKQNLGLNRGRRKSLTEAAQSSSNKVPAPAPNPPPAPTKPAPYCSFPNCKVPPLNTCSRYKETQYCSKEHQTAHWKWHKKICVAPQKKISAPVPPEPPVPLKGSVNEEEEDEDTCIICLDNVANAKLRPCGYSASCRKCTEELRKRGEPCPLCKKPIAGVDVGGVAELDW